MKIIFLCFPAASLLAPVLGGDRFYQAAPRATQTTVPTGKWLKLKNVNGWKIEHPPNWEATGHENGAADADIGPNIMGPKGSCSTRCADVQIMAQAFRPSDPLAHFSPREYVMNGSFRERLNRVESCSWQANRLGFGV